MNATSPLAAMIWKELREGLKWAALALLLTAGAVIFVLANHRGFGPGHTQYRGVGSPILADDFQAVTIIASAVTALLLSLAQTMPEKRLDKWAFLVHRPVSRTRLLLGKIIAGLILYAIAVGVPFLGAILWVATPGHVPAPFEPAMALPGVADLLAGVMYYFAGMLIGLREARWYGSRVLPIGLAITASVAVFAVPAFWQALLVILGVTAVLAVAAWGSFVAGGHYAPQPRVAKTALGIAVFAGVVLLGGAGVAMLAGMLSAQRDEWVYTNYAVSPKGKIYRYTQRQSGTSATVTVTDPAGNPVAQYPQSVDAAAFHTTMQSTPSAGMWVGKQQSIAGVFRSYRRAERYSLTLSPGQEEAWYYVMSKGHVVGYDARDSRVIG